MKHVQFILGATFVAVSLFSSVVFAAEPAPGNKADATKVMPARDDLKPGDAPSVEKMGDNAQRQHSKGAAGSKATDKGADARGAAPQTGGRDWTKIDKNGDHLIGPDEMEQWLKDNPVKAAPKS